MMRPTRAGASRLRRRWHIWRDLRRQPAIAGFDRKLLLKNRVNQRAVTLTYPPVLPVRNAGLLDDEIVLGISRGGEARAYPTAITPDVVNDAVAGGPLLVTFCRRCSSGVAFVPVVDERRLTFETYGSYKGALVMRDKETGSLWTHQTGAAIAGALAGRSLSPVPLHMVKLGEWLRLHPDSLTFDPAVTRRGQRWMPGSYPITARWRSTLAPPDRRLDERTLVLGVEAGGVARAYPMQEEPPGPLALNETLGRVPIAIVAPTGGWPVVFDRRLHGETVELDVADAGLVDGSGVLWTWEGARAGGPRTETSLSPVPSHISEWYAWSAFHPGSEMSPASAIEAARR